MSDDCIFCKIASGSFGTEFLWEDDDVVAFRDIDPQAPTHVLVIPREHLASCNDLTPGHAGLMGHLIGVATIIAGREGLKDAEAGYRLVINTGPDGGQSVDHLHLHLLGGRALTWPPG